MNSCRRLQSRRERLLELILPQDGQSARALLLAIAQELKHPAPAVVIAGGCDILQTFFEREIILGTRR